MLGALNRWLYDGDPITALAFEAPLTAVKARVAGGLVALPGLTKRRAAEQALCLEGV